MFLYSIIFVNVLLYIAHIFTASASQEAVWELRFWRQCQWNIQCVFREIFQFIIWQNLRGEHVGNICVIFFRYFNISLRHLTTYKLSSKGRTLNFCLKNIESDAFLKTVNTLYNSTNFLDFFFFSLRGE